MKKGFTLVELLAVIIILAVISTIVVPIVLNIVNDSKKSTYQSSVELYGKAVKQAILNYELDKKVTPTTFKQIKPYLEFEGNNVECNTKIIYEDGEIYLKDCSVDGNLVEDYTYGKATLADTILKHAMDNKYYYKTKPDFTKSTGEGEYGLYVAKDDLGDSYYFRGDVENNYVQFGIWNEELPSSYVIGPNVMYDSLEDCEKSSYALGGSTCREMGGRVNVGDLMYWRIIRTNGDGTIRLLYDGTQKVSNGVEHFKGIVKSSQYNGFNSSTASTLQERSTEEISFAYIKNEQKISSSIKINLDRWYKTNLKKNYDSYIADEIYCNDRKIFSGIYDGETEVVYNPLNRTREKSPILTCERNEDKFTISEDIGNGLLDYPIGLITADETLMIGNITNSFIYSDKSYWTMSPSGWHQYNYGQYVNSFIVDSYDGLSSTTSFIGATSDYRNIIIRPVISLKLDVRFTGTGTIDDPYVIMTD